MSLLAGCSTSSYLFWDNGAEGAVGCFSMRAAVSCEEGCRDAT